MKGLLLLLLLMLGACATTRPAPIPEPIIITKEVLVPGPAVGCVPKKLGPPPAYVDSDDALLKAADAAERYMLIFAGRMQRIARLGEVEPIVQSCPKG